jgi:hypothetical protein
MEGGPVVTDAEHWQRRYNELAKDCADAREIISEQAKQIRDLKKDYYAVATKVEKRST